VLDPSLLTSNDLNRPSTLQLVVDSMYLGSLLSCICQSFSCAIVFFSRTAQEDSCAIVIFLILYSQVIELTPFLRVLDIFRIVYPT